MKKSILMMAVLLAYAGQAWSVQISKEFFQPTLMDQVQFIVCEQQPCSPAILKSVGSIVAREFAQRNIQTDFREGSLCGNCSGQAVAIEQLVAPAKAQFVRSIARQYADVVSQVTSSSTISIVDLLLDATKDSYIQVMGGYDRYMNMLIELTNKVKGMTRISGEPVSFYRHLIQNSYVAGSFRNAKSVGYGCATGGGHSCLSQAEIAAARYYMGQGYGPMNTMMMQEIAGHGPKNNNEAQIYGQNQLLKSLLGKLRPAYTVSYRGIGSRQAFQNFQAGYAYTEHGFISTSLNSRISQRFMQGVGLILFTKTCPLISGSGGLFDGEDEVLCKAGTQFRILHREDRGGNLYFILEEI